MRLITRLTYSLPRPWLRSDGLDPGNQCCRFGRTCCEAQCWCLPFRESRCSNALSCSARSAPEGWAEQFLASQSFVVYPWAGRRDFTAIWRAWCALTLGHASMARPRNRAFGSTFVVCRRYVLRLRAGGVCKFLSGVRQRRCQGPAPEDLWECLHASQPGAVGSGLYAVPAFRCLQGSPCECGSSGRFFSIGPAAGLGGIGWTAHRDLVCRPPLKPMA